MDAQQAAFLAQQSTGVWQWESNATAAVLAAVPNDKRDYKPDAKSRTAWEIAQHMAGADVWFLQSILAKAFGAPTPPAATTVADLAAWYKHEFPAHLEKVLEIGRAHV